MNNPNPHNKKISTPSKDSYFAARLLSRNDDITIQEKEHVLAAVLRQSQPNSKPQNAQTVRFWWAFGAAATALVAAVTAFWFWPVFEQTHKTAEFTPKGDTHSPAFFEIHCLQNNTSGPCVTGARLAFTIMQLHKKGTYFAALAVREKDGTVIWMYPAAPDGQSVSVSASNTSPPKAILLDNHYLPGQYQIIGILSRQPMNRSQIKKRVIEYENTRGSKKYQPHQFPKISEITISVKEP